MVSIQIDGIYFPNKGDELMYHAIVQNFQKQQLNSLLVYGVGKGSPDPFLLRQTGVFQLSILQRFKIRFDKLFPQKYLFRYGLVRPEDINVILDSGGFQFGDQWEERYSDKMCNALENYYERYKKRGSKIIMLPQALGPFNKKNSRKVIQVVYKYSDLIFARDIESYKYLVEAVGTSEKIQISPDFTCMVDGNMPLPGVLPKEYITVIPNAKMITHTDELVSRVYMDYLINLLKACLNANQEIVFLNHEGEGDQSLIHTLNNGIQNKGIVLSDLNSIGIKSVIKHSKLLISPRYHGVVSGLSQGVPTFCTSWSHKYVELLKDYGVEDHLLDVNDVQSSFEKINKHFVKDEHYSTIQIHKIKEQKEKVILMWNKIFQLIK